MRLLEKLTVRIHKKELLRGVAALLGAALVLFCQPYWMPLAQHLAGHATLFSTALTLPAGAMEALRERFAGDLAGEESSSVPEATAPSSQSPGQLPAHSSSPAPTAEPPASESSASSSEKPPEPPEIPTGYRAPLVTLTMLGEKGNPAFLEWNNIWLRNYTKLSLPAIAKVLELPSSLRVGGPDQPQVLIYHTHTTESYEAFDSQVYDTRNSWRDTDNTNNMAAVGELLAEELRRQGIAVLHDTTQHDHPSYNGAYDRSRKTMKQYLKEYPSIAVTIDLHRDGIIQSDNTVLRPVVEVGGKKAAQLMIIAPCDDGTVNLPGWKENLRFAVELQQSIDQSVPDLCRPIFFCYRNYNLGLTKGSLLFELGTNGNTLEEAKYTARLIAQPLADTLKAHMKQD